jgi:hypothetical protein
MTLRGNPEHGEGIRSRGKRKAQLRNEEISDRNRGLAPTEDAVGRLDCGEPLPHSPRVAN